jgi:hypothetical protein
MTVRWTNERNGNGIQENGGKEIKERKKEGKGWRYERNISVCFVH